MVPALTISGRDSSSAYNESSYLKGMRQAGGTHALTSEAAVSFCIFFCCFRYTNTETKKRAFTIPAPKPESVFSPSPSEDRAEICTAGVGSIPQPPTPPLPLSFDGC